MIHFLNITLQANSEVENQRAFLDWADRETNTVYQPCRYGTIPVEAADNA